MNKYAFILVLFALFTLLSACNTSTHNEDNNRADSTAVAGQTNPDLTPPVGAVPMSSEHTSADKDSIIEIVPSLPQAKVEGQLPQGEGAPMRKEGIHYASVGKYKEAIQAFNESIKREPGNSDAWFYRAKAKADLKDYAGAEADYKKAIELRSDVPAYFYYRGEMRATQKKYDAALADFDRTLAMQPTYTDAINYKGVMLANKGEHQAAISFYNQAIEKKPDFALAYYNKATSLAALKQFVEAEVDFSQAISIEPKYNEALINRGNVRFMIKKYAEAVRDYSEALESTPNNGDIYYNRAFSYQRLQQPEKACADWLKAEQLGHPAAAGMLKQYCESGK